MKDFHSNLSSDSDSDIEEKLDKLKFLFSDKKTISQYLTTSSAPQSTFCSPRESFRRYEVDKNLNTGGLSHDAG